MTSSLIPERPLLISPTLAATIGLEEAVMLHVISELQLRLKPGYRNRRRWTEIEQDQLQAALPFWTLPDIKRIQQNLQEKGLILVEPVPKRPDCQLYAINQIHEAPASEPRAQPTPPGSRTSGIFDTASSGRATYIPPDWQPNEELFQQCCQQHSIPREFVEQRVKSFVMYQRERRKTQYSWHQTFLKYIIREWRNEQSYRGAKELEAEMSAAWQPSDDAISILEHAGINLSFIEDSIPEFILYWRERGLVTSTWNTKFIAHVRRQWAKFTTAVEHDATPRPISLDYKPSPACLEVLELAN
ncbi:MAG: DnaT-like ssDNA-binding domain-containing protein, partial [Pseudohongiellaceae bacterium]